LSRAALDVAVDGSREVDKLADSFCNTRRAMDTPKLATTPTKHYHLILFHQRASIGRGTVSEIQERLDEVVSTPRDQNLIDVWVESPGGDAHCAYKIMLELRARAARVRAVIPDYAKSAATLIVLGADEVFMAAAAELGPLDAQVEHPDKDRTISSLDIADSLESLSRTAMDLTLTSGGILRDIAGLPRPLAVQTAVSLSSNLLQPVIGKLDPHLIHEAKNLLVTAEKYGVDLLGARNVGDKEVMSDQQALELVRKLVKQYPSHGYVISRIEAKNLGLPIRVAENHPRWSRIKTFHKNYESSGPKSLILALNDSSLDPPNQQAASAPESEGVANG
jgi:hypothetical protein